MDAAPQWKCKTDPESRRPVFVVALVIVTAALIARLVFAGEQVGAPRLGGRDLLHELVRLSQHRTRRRTAASCPARP